MRWRGDPVDARARRLAQQGAVAVRRLVLVSPFTGLPWPRVAAARAALALAWRPAYAAHAPPVSRLAFGPAPRPAGDAFFRAIAGQAPPDVRRRVGWLAATDFASAFLALCAPAGAWPGERARLVNLARQLAFFTALTGAPGSRLTVIPGSGHVVLPPGAVGFARATITGWLTGTVT